MKKLLTIVLAAVAMVACTNNEVVELNQEAICFQNAFVENGTKATDNFTVTKTNLGSFNVWATTQHGTNAVVPILAEESVSSTDNGATWGYTKTQYWIEGNQYEFVALKNYKEGSVTLTNGLPTEFSYEYNAASPLDVVVAAASATGKASGNTSVGFTFEHLLAKAYFTLENTITTNTADSAYTYELTGVQITTPFEADCAYDGSDWTWENQSALTTLSFGNTEMIGGTGATAEGTAANAHLLIPYNHTALAVAFTINTYYNGGLVNTEVYNKTIAKNIEQGNVYNFQLTLGNPGEEIEFSVNSVDAWVDGSATL